MALENRFPSTIRHTYCTIAANGPSCWAHYSTRTYGYGMAETGGLALQEQETCPDSREPRREVPYEGLDEAAWAQRSSLYCLSLAYRVLRGIPSLRAAVSTRPPSASRTWLM